MNDAMKLSICMPTYQNPSGVRAALESIAAQAMAAGIAESVEFCISDNSTGDETATVVRIYGDRVPKVRYHKNGENVGYDRNVDHVLKMATGTFCWLLSDNEQLRPGSLAAVYNAVSSSPDIGHIVIAESAIPPENLRRYATLEEAIRENNFWIPGGLVSRNIFKRALIPPVLDSYFGNDWIHLSVAFAIGGDHPMQFIPEQFDDDKAAVCAWARDGKTFRTFTNLLAIVRGLPSSYSAPFRRTFARILERRLPREILSAKLYGLRINRATLQGIVRALGKRPILLLLAIGALLVPTPILRYAKYIKTSTHS